MKLNTSQPNPYDNDWVCTDENYQADTDNGYWEGHGIVGEGRTEQEAIDNYWEQSNEQL